MQKMNLKELNFDNFRQKFDSLSTAGKVGAGFAALSATYLAFNTTKYLFWRHQEKNKKFNSYTTNDEALMGKDFNGRVAIVTGCNIGIGYQTAKTLVKHGCCVIMACRTENKAIAARQKIMEELSIEDGISIDDHQLVVMKLDLSDLSSVLNFVKKFNSTKSDLHYLINNAGLMCPDYRTSKDGYELQFATMHLGHFYLTRLLWNNLEATGEKEKGFKTRVINLTSVGHSFLGNYNFSLKMFDNFIKNKTVMSNEYKKYYQSYFNYGIAKTCNILFSREIAHKMSRQNKNSNVVSYSVHPGGDSTSGLGRDGTISDFAYALYWVLCLEPSMIYKEMKTPQQIASCTLYCVAQDVNKLENGAYYANCELGKNNGKLYPCSACGTEIRKDSHELGQRMWQLSEILIQDKGFSLDTPK